MPFLNKAKIKNYSNQEYRLVEDLDYFINKSVIIRIPHGFIFTLPFFLDAQKLHNKKVEPYILQAWLNDTYGLINSFKRLSREECNQAFLTAAKEEGIGKIERTIMYYYFKIENLITWQ